MFRTDLILAALTLTSTLYAADPISEVRDAVAAGQAAAATELATQKAVVGRTAGSYRADVVKADPVFGVQEKEWFKIVVTAAQDATLGQVEIQIGDAKNVCQIVTAQGGKVGFNDLAHPGKLVGFISPIQPTKPAKLILMKATLVGSSSLEAILAPME